MTYEELARRQSNLEATYQTAMDGLKRAASRPARKEARADCDRALKALCAANAEIRERFPDESRAELRKRIAKVRAQAAS